MNKDEHKIRQLIDRFMAGKTTVDEEQLIGEWFQNHPNAAPDLEPYRLMFDYFEQGMPIGAYGFGTTGGSGEACEQSSSGPRRVFLWRIIGVAASLLVLIGVSIAFFGNGNGGKSLPQKEPAIQMAAVTQPTDSVNPMAEKPDTASRQTVPVKAKAERKPVKRHRELPPKPVAYMASKAQNTAEKEVQTERLNGEITLNMLQGEILFNQLVASMAYYDEAEEEQNITY